MSWTKEGRTPLIIAAIGGQVEAVRLLLQAGADPLVSHSGRYAGDFCEKLSLKTKAFDIQDKLLSRLVSRNRVAWQSPLLQLEPSHVKAQNALGKLRLLKIEKAETGSSWSKNETNDWQGELKTALSGLLATFEVNNGTQALFYSLLGELWSLRGEQDICLGCLKEKRSIARSHFIAQSVLSEVSHEWFDPLRAIWHNETPHKSNSLPLFCRDAAGCKKAEGEKVWLESIPCEEHFSLFGEGPFKDSFAPNFMTALKDQLQDGSLNLSFKYDQSLFYNAILHAYRIILSNLDTEYHWASDSNFERVTALPQLLVFVEDMRKFLNSRNSQGSTRALVFLFLETNEMHGKRLTFLQSRKSTVWGYRNSVLFGVNGFFFLVLDNKSTLELFYEELQGEDIKGFEIDPKGGLLEVHEIEIPTWQLPPLAYELREEFKRRLFLALSNTDLQKVAGKGVVPKEVLLFGRASRLPADVLIYHDNLGNPVPVWMRDGIEIKAIGNLDSGEIVRLYHHSKSNRWHLITHHYNDGNHLLLGFQFNYEAANAYLDGLKDSNNELIFEALAAVSKIEPLDKISHAGINYPATFPAKAVLAALRASQSEKF